MSSPALPADHLVLCSECGLPQPAGTAFAPAQLKKKHPRCRACAPNKFSNRREGGHQSKKESRRAEELETLAKIGAIRNLQQQVPFVLIPAQRDPVTGRVVERACTYVADFVYDDHLGHHVEDAKGMRTDVYRLKRKMMGSVHGIRIEEV
jgi:hypothetical protein